MPIIYGEAPANKRTGFHVAFLAVQFGMKHKHKKLG